MSATDDAGGDTPLPPGAIESLAEALSGESHLESEELSEVRELAGLSAESFEALSEIIEALEFRGVSREAEALPDPAWVKDVVLQATPMDAPDSKVAPDLSSASIPTDDAPLEAGHRRQRLWLVPLALAAAAVLFMMNRPDAPGSGPGQGGFEGDPGAVLSGEPTEVNADRALLSTATRSVVLPVRLSTGDEVRVSIRKAGDASPWEPIALKSSQAEIPIPAADWARLDQTAEYEAEVVAYRLSSGSEERVTLPLHWQP